jgi:hypothetical protein
MFSAHILTTRASERTEKAVFVEVVNEDADCSTIAPCGADTTAHSGINYEVEE